MCTIESSFSISRHTEHVFINVENGIICKYMYYLCIYNLLSSLKITLWKLCFDITG